MTNDNDWVTKTNKGFYWQIGRALSVISLLAIYLLAWLALIIGLVWVARVGWFVIKWAWSFTL